MNCDQVSKLLDAYMDGESLDALRQQEIAAHLAGCADCAAKLSALQHVRDSVSSTATYYKASDRLMGKLGEIGAEPLPKAIRTFRLPFLQWGVAACVVLLGLNLWAVLSHTTDKKAGLEAELVSAHIRSLQAQHLIDVVSTDRHTVKPWFQGKLDFSPTVPDLRSQGWPLIGGRLDYIADRPAAALVYMRGKHAINVFIWRSTASAPSDATGATGYRTEHWQSQGLSYWAVSDVDAENLASFAKAFQASQ